MPQFMKLKNEYEIKVHKNIDEPSDIKWENLEVTYTEKILRKIFVFFILLLTMFITFIIIILTNITK